MPKVSVQLETSIVRDFALDQVAGMFDVELEEKSRMAFSVALPALTDDWRIGAIVGPSGSGKTVVAKKAFGKNLWKGFRWPQRKAIISAFPRNVPVQDRIKTLEAVGFSSPPAWALPYHVLSNGQQFRCDLARALLISRGLLAFDEFTSVVDRQVGRFASAALSKAVRKRRVRCERFVAITCHYDVLDWLEPDWVLDMANCQLARGCLQRRKFVRPPIELHVHRCQPGVGKRLWSIFRRHHYLSASLFKAATCYVGIWEHKPIAFCATKPLAGHVGRRIVTRLVVLPDYQGMGIGIRLMEKVMQLEGGDYMLSVRFSHPAMMTALNSAAARKRGWRCTAFEASGPVHRGRGMRHMASSVGRTTASFEWRGGSIDGRPSPIPPRRPRRKGRSARIVVSK